MSGLAPKGLICPLFLPSGNDAERLISQFALRVLPHVDGLAVDPGFFPLGPVPGPEEMARVVQMVRASAPNTPLFVKLLGADEDEVARCLELFESLLECGEGEVFYLDAPLNYRGNRGLPEHYRRLLAKTERGVVLVNDPGLLKVRKGATRRKSIRTNILKRLAADEEGIVGLVHRGTLKRGLNYLKAVAVRPGFRLYEGREPQFIDSPATAGVFAASANLMPYEWYELVAGVLKPAKPERARAARLFHLGERLKELSALVEESPHNVVAAGLSMLGLMPEGAPGLPEEALGELMRLLHTEDARVP